MEYKPKNILQKSKTGTGSKGSGSRFCLHRYIKRKEYKQNSPWQRGQKGGMSTKIKRKDKSYETVDHLQQGRRLLEPHL